jgi:sporulation protein YlmC with PRC-barrel domain
MKAKELIGKEILDVNAKTIGKVVDLEVDVIKGLVEYVEVKSGFKKHHIVSLDKIEVVGDKVILKVKGEDL